MDFHIFPASFNRFNLTSLLSAAGYAPYEHEHVGLFLYKNIIMIGWDGGAIYDIYMKP